MKKQKSKTDLYVVLDIVNTSTQEEIKKAFKKKAIEFHPDKNIDKKDSEEKFKEVKLAYEVLSDPGKRKIYDSTGQVHQYSDEVKIKFKEALFEELIVNEILNNENFTIESLLGFLHNKITELKRNVFNDEKKLERLNKFLKSVKKNKNCKDDFLLVLSDIKYEEIGLSLKNIKYQIELMIETKEIIASGYYYKYYYDKESGPNKKLMGHKK